MLTLLIIAITFAVVVAAFIVAATADAFVAMVFLAAVLAVAASLVGIGTLRRAARLNSVERHFYHAVLSSNALFFVRWAKGAYEVTAYVGGNRVITFRTKDVQYYGDLVLFCGTFLAVPQAYVQIISVRPQLANGAKANRQKKP